MATDPRTPNVLAEIWQGVNTPPLEVITQDQTTPIVNLFFIQATGAPTTSASPVAIDDFDITLTDATDFDVGTYIGVFSGAAGAGRYYFGEVLSKSVNTLTMDTPFDFAFAAGSNVLPSSKNLAVDGSTTQQVFSVDGTSSFDIDITRLIFSMVLENGAPDDAKFGDIAGGITRGLVCRKTDGTTRNIFNVKDNGELAAISYDLTYTTRSGGSGSWGMRCRYTFAGQEKQGVVIRLGAGEKLEMLIDDDLSSISRFWVIAEGHEVQP